MNSPRDDTLVSPQALQAAIDHMGQHGFEAILQSLGQAEPYLGHFLTENATRVAGKLALAGAPHEVVTGVHADLLSACALVYVAVRRGSYEIWQGTALGDRLQDLEVATPTEEGQTAAGAEPEGPLQQVLLLGIAPRHKTQVLSLVRQLTGQPAREVRRLLEQVPVVLLSAVPPVIADAVRDELVQAGGRVALCPVPPTSEASPEANPSNHG
jgi:ribosomal protein L7/L12